jgi:hypothetical protein
MSTSTNFNSADVSETAQALSAAASDYAANFAAASAAAPADKKVEQAFFDKGFKDDLIAGAKVGIIVGVAVGAYILVAGSAAYAVDRFLNNNSPAAE